MPNVLRRLAPVVALAAVLAAASAAQAGTVGISFTGTAGTGIDVAATALLDFQDGYVDITLTNVQSGITNAGQLLTGFDFALSGGSGTASMTSAVADRTIDFRTNSSGTISGTSGFGTGDVDIASEWVFGSLSGGGYGLGWNGGTGPDTGIIASGWGTLNSSVSGNGPHNPLVLDAARFRISQTGITTSTTVSSYSFFFGTAPTEGTPAVAVPLPPALLPGLLMLGSIVTFTWMRRRRRATLPS